MADNAEQNVIHLDASVVKVTREGNEVLSNYIERGETLQGGVTFDDVKNGILVKAHKVEHTDDRRGLTTDETKTSTVTMTKDDESKDEKASEPETQKTATTDTKKKA